jgi:hypothetical protein
MQAVHIIIHVLNRLSSVEKLINCRLFGMIPEMLSDFKEIRHVGMDCIQGGNQWGPLANTARKHKLRFHKRPTGQTSTLQERLWSLEFISQFVGQTVT